ncbi:MAG: hypothetical protein EPN25_04295 [Nitrospirae bacterium]|nr:MAG: hypothetical protein EPN25_04295 [Nitrospirota bacterium]
MKNSLMIKNLLFTAALSLLASCATIAGVDEPYYGKRSAVTDSRFPYDKYSEGKPTADLRLQGGIYLWRVGNFWSVRVAKKLDRVRPLSVFGPVIAGTVSVDNGITSGLKVQSKSPLSDVRLRRNEVIFKFEMRDDMGSDIEGFDFKVDPKGLDYCVTFDIQVDGVSRPGSVHLGSFMHNPDEVPVTICLRSTR